MSFLDLLRTCDECGWTYNVTHGHEHGEPSWQFMGRKYDRERMLRFADAWQTVGMAATGRGIGEKAWRVTTCKKLGIPTDQRLMTGAEFIGALAKIGEGVEWLDDEGDE